MSIVELLLLLVIAAICGGIGQALIGYSTGGCLVSIAIGVIGAYLGVWIAREFGLPLLLPIAVGGQSFPIIWSIIGSAALAALLGVMRRGLR